ncbi:MAG: hypothetical protein DME06_15595 [Candidatus Rokuibacteriota bacterium]|nr:MAG: hypothetical protein DME06_15595 [Candidatus Rokubacteria bacterium]
MPSGRFRPSDFVVRRPRRSLSGATARARAGGRGGLPRSSAGVPAPRLGAPRGDGEALRRDDSPAAPAAPPARCVARGSAGGAEKRWSAGGFAQSIRGVVRETGCQVVVHEGPADKAAAGELLATPDLPMLRVLEPPLPVLAAILREAAAYLGGDTGVSHLAAAVGSPAVILFPPASRPRWTPWSQTALPLTMPDPSGTIAPVVRALIERVSGVVAMG